MGSISVAMPVAVAPMSGIRTAAATVSGGVTTYDKAPKKPRGGVRTTGQDTPPSPCQPAAESSLYLYLTYCQRVLIV
jgi:hypothetical protein